MKKIILSLLVALLLPTDSVFAANSTTNSQATASLAKSCAFSVAPATFGNFVPATTGVSTTSSTISVTCTRTTTYTITADAFRRSTCGRRELGLNGSIGGADYLLYNIYVDSAYTQILSYPVCSSVAITGTGTGSVFNHSLYLQMNNNQFVKPGSYSDAVPVTLTF